MSTTSRWVIPCSIVESKFNTSSMKFVLTNHLKLILKNEVWKRKFDYGYNSILKNIDLNTVETASITIHPKFISGKIDTKRIIKIIKDSCKEIPKYLKITNYSDWPYDIGVAIIEIKYKTDINNIPHESTLSINQGRLNDISFIEIYDKYLAILKELSSLFLASLHLSFQSHSVFLNEDDPMHSGFFQISCNGKIYAKNVGTKIFMHQVLIEKDKNAILKHNLKTLATIWHYDLWPLKRYLKAVESDQISMDELLDLLYALEGMFEKNVSSDYIKTVCLVLLCKTKKEAGRMKAILDEAYRIRNQIVHGAFFYTPYEEITIENKKIPAQNIYWEVKSLVAGMLIKSISIMIKTKGMKNLRFNFHDFINEAF